MTSFTTQRDDFVAQLVGIRALIATTSSSSVSRETRGLAIVLLYAAYERLLKSVVRVVLEDAKHKVGANSKLSLRFKVFSVHSQLQSLATAQHHRDIWTKQIGMDLLNTLHNARDCSLNPNVFPDSGHNMKAGQVDTVCRVLDLGQPAAVLKEVWQRLDSVVDQRNQIAHGQTLPQDIGRNYSEGDLLALIQLWETRWLEFVAWVEQTVNAPGYYGTRRYRRP